MSLEVVVGVNAANAGVEDSAIDDVEAEGGHVEHQNEDELPHVVPSTWVVQIPKFASQLHTLNCHVVYWLRNKEDELEKGQVLKEFACAHNIPSRCSSKKHLELGTDYAYE